MPVTTRTPRRIVTPTRGRPYRVICISQYVDDLDEIDRAAAAARVSRSEYVRLACLKLAREPKAAE